MKGLCDESLYAIEMIRPNLFWTCEKVHVFICAYCEFHVEHTNLEQHLSD